MPEWLAKMTASGFSRTDRLPHAVGEIDEELLVPAQELAADRIGDRVELAGVRQFLATGKTPNSARVFSSYDIKCTGA